jgi:hypothetical protein
MRELSRYSLAGTAKTGTHLRTNDVLIEVEGDFTTDGQSASLTWCSFHLELMITFFFLTIADFRCGAPSLTNGRVCNLLLLQGLASAVLLRSESHWTKDSIFYCSSFLDSPNLVGQVPIFTSPRNRVIPPGTRFPFRRLFRLTGLRWRYSIPPPIFEPISSHISVELLHHFSRFVQSCFILLARY